MGGKVVRACGIIVFPEIPERLDGATASGTCFPPQVTPGESSAYSTPNHWLGLLRVLNLLLFFIFISVQIDLTRIVLEHM